MSQETKIKDFIVTDYIKKKLNEVARAEGFSNYHLNIDYGSKIGDGFIGVILKVIIQENERNLKVLAKVPPSNKVRREVLRSMDFFEREVFMYKTVLPAFVAFQKENDIKEGFYNFPKVYLAECTDEDSIIIMDDLRDKDFKNWNKFKPMDFEHSKLIMSTLGKFHSISLAMKLKEPEKFQKLSSMKEVFFKFRNEKSVERLRKMFGKLLELAPDNERIIKLVNEIDKEVLECIDPLLAEPFAVITHGDCWINNFLFHYDQNGQPDDIMIIDWQTSRYSSPILDLVYFIFISTDKHLREKYYNELLSIYQRSFSTNMEFPFDIIKSHLKKFGKFGLIEASFVVPLTQTQSEELPDFDAAAEEIKKQKENQTDEIKPIFAPKSNNAVDERLRDVIADVITYGYL